MTKLRLSGLQRLGDLAAARGEFDFYVEALFRSIPVFYRDESRGAEQVIDDDEGDLLHLRMDGARISDGTERGTGDGRKQTTARYRLWTKHSDTSRSFVTVPVYMPDQLER
jgi:hypothetical protein